MLRKRLFELGLLVALLAGLLVGLPVQAQDDPPPPEDPEAPVVTVEFSGQVTGEISVGDGGIVVDGMKVAPAGAFQPSEYKDGECVIVTGVLLNSGVVQATDIQVSEEPEVDCPPTGEDEGEGTGEEVQNQVEEQNQEQEMEGCTTGSHPVLEAYVAEFGDELGVTYEDLEGWHCDDHMGLGEIGRALLMAEAAGVEPGEIVDARTGGDSWGQIKKDYGIKGSDLAPGRVISGHHQTQETSGEEGESVAPGNSGNAHDQNGNNPGHGGNPPGQEKDKGKPEGNPGQGGGKNK